MTRAEYTAMRRAAYDAERAYRRERAMDGRSNYGAHSIRCNFALLAAEAARRAVPRNRDDHATRYRRLARIRRGNIEAAIINRRSDRARGRVDDWYTQQVRQLLRPIQEVRHV